MKRLQNKLAIGVVAAVAVVAVASTASAGGDKVNLCHWSEGNGYISISISANAAENHLAQHDEDLLIGGSVTADCQTATTVFARAFSTDSTGNETLIAQIEDTNGDKALSPGDTIRTDQYPLNFDATAFGTFAVTAHTVATIGAVSNSSVEVFKQNGDRFRLVSSGWEEYSETDAVSGLRSWLWDDGGTFLPPDLITVQIGTPSAPSIAVVTPSPAANGIDDAYLEVEISLPTP